MPRSRSSAKKAGATFERQIADYLRDELNQPIDRLVKTGAKDRGDIGPLRDSKNRLIAVECKNTSKMALPQWVREAQAEADNYGAHLGIIIHKRHGSADPAQQWVTLTLQDLVKLLR
ncbi:putative PDDEXK endonuclease [Corynebacterium lubricantis]|uniref:putative PDDEXK endonuclease n=1 Tax=Corynebacterium lubricantis TaxID=541095 RepID=UPI0003739DB0|nr:hypothetical protein [Corynebacterium lubricantis]